MSAEVVAALWSPPEMSIMLLQTGNTSYEAYMYGLPPTKDGLTFQVSA